jgi:hypothetical protein
MGKGGPEGFLAGTGLLGALEGFLSFAETFFLEALGAFLEEALDAFLALDFFAMNIPT